jgi:UPF0271 protein
VRIDLNADLGESFGNYVLGDDAALMPVVTSANVAAGFHAGDPSILRRTIRLARRYNVRVGCHPSFPDLAGFGRREMTLPDWEVEDAVLYQIASVAGVASAEGMTLRHVKPHGALYNMAARDGSLAEAVIRAMLAFDQTIMLFAPPDSELERAARAANIGVVREGFVDRAYDCNGRLVSRRINGSVIEDAGLAAAQAVRIATKGVALCLNGEMIPMRVDTLCIHGDLPGAALRATRIRAALSEAGVNVAAPDAR